MQHQSKGPPGNQRMKAALTHQEKDEEAGQQPLPLHGAVLGEQAPDPTGGWREVCGQPASIFPFFLHDNHRKNLSIL